MKCLDGELLETKYDWPSNDFNNNEEKEMIEKGRTVLKKNEVCYINGIFIHFILNLVSNLR